MLNFARVCMTFFSFLPIHQCTYYAFHLQCSGSRSAGCRYFSLLRDKNFIGGEWVAASSGKTFQVTNPVNDKVIGIAQDSTPEDAEKAIKVASGSFNMWADLPAKEKGIKLKSLLKLVNSHSDDLAKLITAECGKPLAEAKAEVMYSAGNYRVLHCIVNCSIHLSFMQAIWNGMLKRPNEFMEKF